MTAATAPPTVSDSSERVRSFLAIFVVVASYVFIGIAWASTGISGAERMAAVFTGMIGLVIGHYFGSRGVDTARRNEQQVRSSSRRDISDAGDKNRQVREQLEGYVQEVEGQVQAYEDQIREYHAVVREYGDLLTKAEANPDQKVKDLLGTI